MPINKYYKGHGSEVMAEMKKHYGPEKGEEVFYATANKMKMAPPDRRKVSKMMDAEKRNRARKRK